jgi:hypothetical protein
VVAALQKLTHDHFQKRRKIISLRGSEGSGNGNAGGLGANGTSEI